MNLKDTLKIDTTEPLKQWHILEKQLEELGFNPQLVLKRTEPNSKKIEKIDYITSPVGIIDKINEIIDKIDEMENK